MAQEQTPTDPLSGLPLLLVPYEEVLAYLWGTQDNSGRMADWNHAYHPARLVMAGGDGSDALRNARKQFVMRADHDEYHACYSGPPGVDRPAERFRHVVLSAAGYIPPDAMDVRARGGPQVVTLTAAQRERLRSSGEVRVASFSVVQKFLKDFVLAQPVDHIRPGVVDRFLSLDSLVVDEANEQRYLVNLLLSLVIDRVEDPLDPPYRFAHTNNLLAPNAPARPGDFIRSIILRSTKNKRHIVQALTEKFITHRRGYAPALGRLAFANS